MTKPRVAHTLTELEVPEVEFFSPTRVTKAIWSFGDLKAAGPDELKPIVLKHLGEKAFNKITPWAYSSIIRPALTYGCHVWARAITDKSIASSLGLL